MASPLVRKSIPNSSPFIAPGDCAYINSTAAEIETHFCTAFFSTKITSLANSEPAQYMSIYYAKR